MEVHASLEIVHARAAASYRLHRFHSALFTGPLFPTESTELPVELLGGDDKPRPFTQDEFDGLHSGALYLVAFGYVAYEDQFGQHWYRFCNWKSYAALRTDFHAQACVPFNQVGDDVRTLQLDGLDSIQKEMK
jgi:hypothetical protein